jgi:hypothetical protein
LRATRARRGVSITDVIEALEAMLASVALPHVQNPWPESIGLGFPFAMAGAAGILVSVLQPEASQIERDRAIRIGNLWGFRLGAGFYVLSLVFQVALER